MEKRYWAAVGCILFIASMIGGIYAIEYFSEKKITNCGNLYINSTASIQMRDCGVAVCGDMNLTFGDSWNYEHNTIECDFNNGASLDLNICGVTYDPCKYICESGRGFMECIG